jgi:ribosomal protein S18 acetylase RimI-like enzyme
MRIIQCNEISKEVTGAFEKLIPQLSTDCNIPTKDYLEQIINSSNSFLFLAKGKEIIGTLTLIIHQIPTGKKAWIEDVVVDNSMRGRGIGKKLILFAIEFAQNQEISKIDLTSKPGRIDANELYKKLGFKQRNTNIYRLELIDY